MALKDWMEAIMFLCRLSGSTIHRDTVKSRNTRKLLVTWKGTQNPHSLQSGLTHCQGSAYDAARTGATAGWGALWGLKQKVGGSSWHVHSESSPLSSCAMWIKILNSSGPVWPGLAPQ